VREAAQGDRAGEQRLLLERDVLGGILEPGGVISHLVAEQVSRAGRRPTEAPARRRRATAARWSR
jgi:hypothetical protein